LLLLMGCRILQHLAKDHEVFRSMGIIPCSVVFWLLFGTVDAYMVKEPVGMIITAKGQASVIRSSGGRVEAKIGVPISVGDLIKTGRQALVKMIFVDQSAFALGSDTELIIDDYAFGQGKRPKSVVTIKNGVFKFMAGKISKMAPENYKVKTATATIGIRGSGGEGITSDGSKGSLPGLVLATAEGHVLEVTTSSGAFYVVDNPSLGLKVGSDGRATRVHIEESLFEGGMTRPIRHESKETQEQNPKQVPQKKGVDLFPYRKTIIRCRKKKGRKITKGDNEMKKKTKAVRVVAVEQLQSRDIAIGMEEKPSSKSMMMRLGREMKQKGQLERLASRSKVIEREKSSSHGVLERLGKEQMKALNDQFAKVEDLPNDTQG